MYLKVLYVRKGEREKKERKANVENKEPSEN
jgi:hypothetical protein